MLALPLVLTSAVACCFFPARRPGPGRVAGLGLLIAAYGFATVLYAPGMPVLHGLLLLCGVAACLWAPDVRRSRLALAGAGVVLAALVAVPVAAALDREKPIVDYRTWSWTGGDPSVEFAWDHAYGPLDWPREGTALLEVRSDEPHYWRAVVLERFDGAGWVREDPEGLPLELPNLVEGSAGHIRDGWYETTEVTVRELRSGLVVSPGSPQTVDGLQGSLASDGTALAGELPASGQSYTVTSYAPDPTQAELQASPAEYASPLSRFTHLELPSGRVGLEDLDLPALDQGDEFAALATTPLDVPLRGEPRPALARAAERAGYGEVYRLAQELTRDAPTPYAAVRAVERHLAGEEFTYSEEPARSLRPLESFLMDQRTGYCQQFSGAMALMLRMAGIPTRVVSGFSPGSPDLDEDGIFVVRDTDAHSWVEVYFSGIGWVPFDPTPAASPAEFQSAVAAAAATPAAIEGGPNGRQREPDVGGGVLDPTRAAGDGQGVPWRGIAFLALLAPLSALAVRRSRRRRHFEGLADAGRSGALARELATGAAVARYEPGTGMTLLALEQRLRAGGRRRAADYAAALNSSRFGADAPPSPGLGTRRQARRDLARSQGLRGRLRLLTAMPPGGPRPGG